MGEGRGDMLTKPSSPPSSSGLSAPPPLPPANAHRSASESYTLSTGSLSSVGQTRRAVEFGGKCSIKTDCVLMHNVQISELKIKIFRAKKY